MDGRIDEEAWQEAEAITEFVQTIPDTGYPATELTDVRILYDDKNLYIGAVCYDSKPEELVVKTLERE